MDLKLQLAWACRILAYHGQNDVTLGHISVLDRAGGAVLMKPQGIGFEEVTPDNLVTIDLDGRQIGGQPHRVHSEWPIHTEVYRARPDVTSVIHAHPLHATALACVDSPLEFLGHDSLLFHAGVGLFVGPPDLLVKPEEGVALAAALGQCQAVLMRNHGVTCCGEDIPAAVCTALQLERAAQVQFIARTLGRTLPVTAEVAARAASRARGSTQQNHSFFAYFVRVLQRAGLDLGLSA